MGPWILGTVLAVVSLVGLLMASRATDGIFYGTGLFFAGVGVLLIFYLIHRHTGSKNDPS
ncbi:MAG: hypothetical protein AAFX81_14810 [Pseudomonadota bacterium]